MKRKPSRPSHKEILVSIARMEKEIYGKIVSESLHDDLRKYYGSFFFRNGVFILPPPNPGRTVIR